MKLTSNALHGPITAYRDGGKMRWQMTSKRTGRVMKCSEWVPVSSSDWVNRMIDKINQERKEAGCD